MFWPSDKNYHPNHAEQMKQLKYQYFLPSVRLIMFNISSVDIPMVLCRTVLLIRWVLWEGDLHNLQPYRDSLGDTMFIFSCSIWVIFLKLGLNNDIVKFLLQRPVLLAYCQFLFCYAAPLQRRLHSHDSRVNNVHARVPQGELCTVG